MKDFRRAAVAAWLVVSLLGLGTLAPAMGQDKALSTERDRVSYMVGQDVGKSIMAAAPDMDVDAFKRAVRNAFEGGKPLIGEDQVQPLAEALMQRIAARNGQAPMAGKVPDVSRTEVGYLVGSDVGRALGPIKDELDLAVFVRGVADRITDARPLLEEAESDALRTAFSARMSDKLQARATELADRNQAEGARFLAGNKRVKGVFQTASGLQYMVLRQGAGPKPGRSDRVRVNYQGTLLDGTTFDSSYDRGQPAEFGLDQVIPGWTEGVSMMPVGGKYRFWIPGDLAYGTKGTPDGPIGPNALLVFDVELMAIER